MFAINFQAFHTNKPVFFFKKSYKQRAVVKSFTFSSPLTLVVINVFLLANTIFCVFEFLASFM